LGLTPYALPAEPRVFAIPETTLRAFAADITARLQGNAIRVAGDPDMKVRRVALGPGYSVPALGPNVDVSIGGENSESGGIGEYALDSTALGTPKGVILLGHMMSEDWGMLEVANWLETFITDVSIEWVPTGEPFSGTTGTTGTTGTRGMRGTTGAMGARTS
jgi:putative NIF3 family GTP cyclohydrolase 1 type 2